jgi:hypothetical protein
MGDDEALNCIYNCEKSSPERKELVFIMQNGTTIDTLVIYIEDNTPQNKLKLMAW